MKAAQRKSILADKLEAHGREIYQCALRLVGHHDLAEDIVQEAYLKLFRSTRIDLASISNWPAYLRSVATSLSYDLIRKRSRQAATSKDSLSVDDMPQSDSVSDHRTPERRHVNRQQLIELQQALGQLTRQDYQIFVLRFIEQLSYRDIAENLGIKSSLVGVSLHRSQKKLIQQLKITDTGDCYVTP